MPIALDLDVVAGRNQILEVTITVSSDVIHAIPAPERLESRVGTPITFGPEQPADSPDGNWIQTTEGKGWFPILRL